MTTSERNARQQGRSQKTRNGSQFLATRVTAATSIQTPGNNLRTGLGAQCAHPAAAPIQASRAPHERACTSTGTPRGHAGTDHPFPALMVGFRWVSRPRGHGPSTPARETARRARTAQKGSHSPIRRSHTPHSPRLALGRHIRQGGPDPHRVWPAYRKQRLRHVDHADASFLSTTRPSSSKVPMASRRRISSGQCAMKSRASTV